MEKCDNISSFKTGGSSIKGEMEEASRALEQCPWSFLKTGISKESMTLHRHGISGLAVLGGEEGIIELMNTQSTQQDEYEKFWRLEQVKAFSTDCISTRKRSQRAQRNHGENASLKRHIDFRQSHDVYSRVWAQVHVAWFIAWDCKRLNEHRMGNPVWRWIYSGANEV